MVSGSRPQVAIISHPGRFSTLEYVRSRKSYCGDLYNVCDGLVDGPVPEGSGTPSKICHLLVGREENGHDRGNPLKKRQEGAGGMGEVRKSDSFAVGIVEGWSWSG